MVYEAPAEQMRRLVDAKVESQFTRALRYVEALGAAHVVPSAGPPCFLDDDLFGFNIVSGDELSIFPDQTAFLARLTAAGNVGGVLNIPGTVLELTDHELVVSHPLPDNEVRAIFTDKERYLRRYQADWSGWLSAHRASWEVPETDLVAELAAWWEPLLAMAPTLRRAVGGACLIRTGTEPDDLRVVIDFPAGAVRAARVDEPHRFRFDIARPLLETVAAERSVDWSNSLFLSCRFRAWRDGEFNEYLYNFFKSLSPERMRRTEAEARTKAAAVESGGESFEEIVIGDHVVERWCPHRQADLGVFGEVDGSELVCTLHGWRFDLETGRCLTAEDRKLRVRRRDT
jgi:UDP-MurNAc hydroxylase